jgi:hypothetical protein
VVTFAVPLMAVPDALPGLEAGEHGRSAATHESYESELRRPA